MEVEKRELLKEIKMFKNKKGQIVVPTMDSLVGEKGKYKLEVGSTLIPVIDLNGKVVRNKYVTFTGEESMVQKDKGAETDISNILEKYGRTGILPIVKDPALYEDFSQAPDWLEAQLLIRKAQEQFDNLPSKLRKRFDNDPQQFLKFCNNDANKDEMIELGLLKKVEPVKEGPIEVIVTNPGGDPLKE